MSWIYAIGVILSALASILAWVAKIWWTREALAAKDAIIKSKDALVANKQQEIEFLTRKIDDWKAAKDETLRARQEKVEELEKQIAGLNAVHAGLNAVQAERLLLQDEKREFLASILAEKDIQIKRLDEQLTKLRSTKVTPMTLLEIQLIRERMVQDKEFISDSDALPSLLREAREFIEHESETKGGSQEA